MICGDESSLCHVAGVCENMDVEIDNYPIGMIPSGLTNDLSGVLGKCINLFRLGKIGGRGSCGTGSMVSESDGKEMGQSCTVED